MSINHLLDRIIESKNKGQAIGITSICSSNPFVIRAGLQQALKHGAPVLIESTCNQVNQFGGYSGMTPAGFVRYVKSIADQEAFPYQQLILGGDHLGPFPWQHEIGEIAMQKAVELVRKYVLVGYTKLHLDASMALSGEDATQKLPPKLAARRTAQLARSSEDACREIGVSPELLRYVIGTEVPAPGGIQRRPDEYPVVSSVAEVEETIQLTRLAFEEQHLHEAWERVSAVVVHAGVEFGDDLVFDYDPSETLKLTKFIETQPNLIYEAHSTDYQTAVGLEQMVAGHFAILKVGPALTFALREALLALEMMETELFGGCEEGKLSQLSRTLESCMLEQPADWEKYYGGDEFRQRFARRYSFSDRVRYYWGRPEVQASLNRLLDNLTRKPLPLSLLSQFLPRQFRLIREGELSNEPQVLVMDKIGEVLEVYRSACGFIG